VPEGSSARSSTPVAAATAPLCSFAAALCAFALALCGCGSAASPITALRPIGAGLRGRGGLKASVYAQGPPTAAALAWGPGKRLWLAAAGLEDHTRDGVYLIDRRGARALKVISGLRDPLGLAWLGGQLYVSSTGRVDAYWGFDGGRFEHHRRVLNGPVAGGENNQLIFAPGRRLLMGVTASCDHCRPRSRWSGSIVSFDPSGGGLKLYARRIRAPFGLALLPGTSELFVTMNQPDDLGARTPGDLLALVREGEDWRFPECYGQGGAACAGVPAPVAGIDKHAAVGGVVLVRGRLAGAATTALVAEWQSGRVLTVALARSGSRYTGTPATFLTGVRNPLALLLSPGGGSLLVADWASGTIYRVG
jgi:glucose/arabinose dehydrogenase